MQISSCSDLIHSLWNLGSHLLLHVFVAFITSSKRASLHFLDRGKKDALGTDPLSTHQPARHPPTSKLAHLSYSVLDLISLHTSSSSQTTTPTLLSYATILLSFVFNSSISVPVISSVYLTFSSVCDLDHDIPAHWSFFRVVPNSSDLNH
ncbi:hypothetical protein VTL71DRAFT_1798 [Oculimacula yallundae]|uniref:Uncharacterized protein n=1 Tax=Oculimacula yallundae TaxID=86028 RepID=A0ABR4CE42_9HELO